jgi:hypothetical protein
MHQHHLVTLPDLKCTIPPVLSACLLASPFCLYVRALCLLQPGADPPTEQELFQWSMELADTAVARLKQKAGPTQYGSFRAALGCLASCAPHFAGRLMQDTQHILEQLMYLRTDSSNRSMRVAAEEALTAVFDQVRGVMLSCYTINVSCRHYFRLYACLSP